VDFGDGQHPECVLLLRVDSSRRDGGEEVAESVEMVGCCHFGVVPSWASFAAIAAARSSPLGWV
jgi:hypothetical protein